MDSAWQAKLTERGMLRPSFVPPAGIRQLRACTRLRTDLTRERTRHWQRLEKLLEDALLKVSAVASTLDTKSVRAMLEALIAGERDPKVLAGLARGRMKASVLAVPRSPCPSRACAAPRRLSPVPACGRSSRVLPKWPP